MLLTLVRLLLLQALLKKAMLHDCSLQIFARVADLHVHPVIEHRLVQEDRLFFIVLRLTALHHVLHFHLSDLLEDVGQQRFLLTEQLCGNLFGQRLRYRNAHLLIIHFLVDFGVLLLQPRHEVIVLLVLVQPHVVLLLYHIKEVEHVVLQLLLVLLDIIILVFQDILVLRAKLRFLHFFLWVAGTLIGNLNLVGLLVQLNAGPKVLLTDDLRAVLPILVKHQVELDEELLLVQAIGGAPWRLDTEFLTQFLP